MGMMDRDELGEVVRQAWIEWAQAQPFAKPSWLVLYDQLSEPDKEADRMIAEAVIRYVDAARLDVAIEHAFGDLSDPRKFEDLRKHQEEIAFEGEALIAAATRLFPKEPHIRVGVFARLKALRERVE